MTYTPPPQDFVDNADPIGGGLGQSLDAASLNGMVDGLVDHETRITTLESAVPRGSNRAVVLSLILGD